jgi:hypothetical protein
MLKSVLSTSKILFNPYNPTNPNSNKKPMTSSPLLDIFKHLTKQDRKALHDFVNSPFHNKREDVILLFQYLDKNAETPLKLKKEAVFSHVFPTEKTYNDKTMRYAMSFLLKCIQQYLIYNDLEISGLDSGKRLNRALRLRGADKAYQKVLGGNFQQLETQPLRHAEFHLQSFQLQLEEYQYRHQKQRTGELRLQEISDSLTDFYVTELLRQACVMHSHKSVSQKSYNQLFLDTVLEKIESGAYTYPPSVSAYFHAYKALTGSSQLADFQILKTIIIEKSYLFPLNEIRDLYLLAINFCIKKLNTGERNFEIEALDLYKNGLQNGAILDNKTLSPFTYKNVMMLALKHGEFEWTEQFLQDFKKYLPVAERENLFKYNFALFHFRQKDYPKAMQLLQEVTLKEVLYNLDARRVLMRIYYELGEYAALDSLLESFTVFLHRHTDLGYHKTSYQNLIKFVKKLRQIDIKNEALKAQLRLEIDNTVELTERDWLLEQL